MQSLIEQPMVNRRLVLIGALAVPAAVSSVMTLLPDRRNIASGIDSPFDPRVVQSCQQFIDMLTLQGVGITNRSRNSVYAVETDWHRLPRLQRLAITNAVTCRAFGKRTRFLADSEIGYVFGKHDGALLDSFSKARL